MKKINFNSIKDKIFNTLFILASLCIIVGSIVCIWTTGYSDNIASHIVDTGMIIIGYLIFYAIFFNKN